MKPRQGKKNEIENFVEPDGYKFRKRGFLVCALFLIRGPVVVSGLMLRQQHSKRLLSDSRERGFAFCVPFIGTGPFSHIFRFSRPSKINNESHMVSEWAFGSRLSVCGMKSDTLEIRMHVAERVGSGHNGISRVWLLKFVRFRY